MQLHSIATSISIPQPRQPQRPAKKYPNVFYIQSKLHEYQPDLYTNLILLPQRFFLLSRLTWRRVSQRRGSLCTVTTARHSLSGLLNYGMHLIETAIQYLHIFYTNLMTMPCANDASNSKQLPLPLLSSVQPPMSLHISSHSFNNYAAQNFICDCTLCYHSYYRACIPWCLFVAAPHAHPSC